MSHRLHAVGAVGAVVLLMLGCGRATRASAEPPSITLALPADAGDAERAGAEAFEAVVEGLSRGAVAVAVSGDGGLCLDAADCLRALQAGEVTLAPVTTTALAEPFPELQVLDLPYLFESAAVVDRVFDGPFHARLRDALIHRLGLRLMAVGGGGGWRALASTQREVRTPDDMRDQRWWTSGSAMDTSLVEALGGTTDRRPRAELASALATGAIDGVTTSVADLVALGLHDRVRYVTLDRHSYGSVFWLINDAAYQALPQAQRLLVEAGCVELERLGLAAPATREAEAVGVVEAASGTVLALTDDERKRFLMAAGRVATGYVEEYGPDWLVWLEGAIAEAEREIELTENGLD